MQAIKAWIHVLGIKRIFTNQLDSIKFNVHIVHMLQNYMEKLQVIKLSNFALKCFKTMMHNYRLMVSQH